MERVSLRLFFFLFFTQQFSLFVFIFFASQALKTKQSSTHPVVAAGRAVRLALLRELRVGEDF